MGLQLHHGRWGSPEFLLYYAYALWFFKVVLKRAWELSAEYGYAERGVLPGLARGLAGRLVDLSDAQWRAFRGTLPLAAAAMAGFVALGGLLRRCLPGYPGVARAFSVLASLAFVTYLHGACVLFLLVAGLANWVLAQALAGGTRAFPLLCWSLACGALLMARVYDGGRFRDIVGPGPLGAWLDQHRGVMRWHISFNFVVLRMISFSMDQHWQRRPPPPASTRPAPPPLPPPPELPLPASLLLYLEYLFYMPLHIAGPVITHRDFAAQRAALASGLPPLERRARRRHVALYAVRWLGALAGMELLTHTCYFNALARSQVWRALPVSDTCIIAFGVLNFMWLKFMLIWRFFRLWALADGITPPENMLRCVNNNYDLEGFWKSWHASYNRWLVRYLYIPLGGSRWRALNVWVIFTFVALWHDLEWHLLSWAWLTAGLCLPELAAKALLRSPRVRGFSGRWWFRECCALAGALNVMGLMAANLVGFVIGGAGIVHFTQQLLEPAGQGTLLLAFVSLYVGVKLMFEIREYEGRCREATVLSGQQGTKESPTKAD